MKILNVSSYVSNYGSRDGRELSKTIVELDAGETHLLLKAINAVPTGSIALAKVEKLGSDHAAIDLRSLFQELDKLRILKRQLLERDKLDAQIAAIVSPVSEGVAS